MTVRFRLLGPVGIQDGATVTGPTAAKPRSVLAMLLLGRSHVVSTSRLAAMLWGGQPPGTAGSQIQTYVSRLRQQLGHAPEIVRQQPGYLLAVEPERVDLFVFEQLAVAGRRCLTAGRPAEAAQKLREALALWSGPALTGVTDFLAGSERPRLEEAHLAALEDRIQADLALGAHGDVVAELTGLVAEHPLRERLRAQLMLSLHGSGRQAEALSVFADHRRLLAEEQGIDPGADLQELHRRILAAEPDPLAVRTTAVLSGRPATPPADIADFTGRSAELDLITEALRPRWQTAQPSACVVTGMAGVGKSALAVHAAHRLRGDYPDGQLYVDLRGRRQTAAADALAVALTALGVTTVPDSADERQRVYRGHVAGRRMLVLVDNASDEAQVRPLLSGEPGSAMLVTARRRLAALGGATLIDLDMLAPDEALELLATVAGPERVSTEPDAAREIVRLCGYLPLAVRVAGARLAAKPHWKLTRLVDRLTDPCRRLAELRVADLDVQADLLTGYQWLAAPAQRAFRLLSLLNVERFAVWTAAMLLDLPVASADELIEQLVDERLLGVATTPGTRHTYYRFHELARALALTKVIAEESAEQRRTALCRVLAPPLVSSVP